MLTDVQVQAPTRDQFDPFRVATRYVEYEFGRDGIKLDRVLELESTGIAEDFRLQRVNSHESMMVQVSNSGEASMASSSLQSVRTENPTQLIYGTGAWSSSFFNTRSGYFFVTAPLPLVAPVRCCSCRSETDTESNDNSTADLYYMDASEFSEDAVDDKSGI